MQVKTKTSYYVVTLGLKGSKSMTRFLFSIACLDETERFQSSEIDIVCKISSIEE